MLKSDIKTAHFLLALVAVFSLFLFQVKLLNLGNNYSPRSFFGFATVAGMMLVFALATLRHRQLYWTPEHAALFAGPICAIASQGAFGVRPDGFEGVAYLCVALLVAGVMAGYLQIDIARRRWTQILFIVTFGLVAQTGLGLFHWTMLDIPSVHFAIPQKFATFHGGFFQKNHFASFTAAMTIWLGWALSGGLPMAQRSRFVLLAVSAFFAFNVFLVGSKMGILGLGGASVLLCGLHVLRRRPPAATRLLAGWAVGVGAAFLLVELGGLSQTGSYAFSNDSYHTRLTMWHISWLAFLEAPVFGHGLGNFPGVYNDAFPRFAPALGYAFADNTADPHNLVIWLLVETGLVGTLLFLVPVLAVGLRAVRARPQNWVLPIILLPLILHTQLEFPYKASGSHYLLVLLIFGSVVGQHIATKTRPVRTWRLRESSVRVLPAALGAGFAGTLFIVLIHTALLTNVASQRHREAMELPLREAVARRLAQSDITHPVLGQFALRQSTFLFSIRALRDSEVVATSSFLKPMFARHVLAHAQGRRVWQIMIDMYLLERDWDGALAFADDVSGFDREASEGLKERVAQFRATDTVSGEFRGLVNEYRRLMETEMDRMTQ